MKTENILESNIKELQSRNITNAEFEHLYNDVSNERLKTLFSWLHGEFMRLFRLMNERLPTGEYEAHFWADPSRDLIFIIERTISLQGSLKKTELSFSIIDYYDAVIKRCRDFLSNSGGSTIPRHMEKVELSYLEPMFYLTESIAIKEESHSFVANLILIGEGSYAKVYKYKDGFYNRYFALKRAKTDLDEKELARFRREFDEMHNLNSPYIVEVYSFNEEPQEYIMEYMDTSLERYMHDNNATMSIGTRKSIISQLLHAFGYLHSKNMFHRDISPKNVMLKLYEDVSVVKIADFGLVKTSDSHLTSDDTDFKGSLNDPALKVEGFGNYGLLHEIYAMTLLFAFIMTGKSNVSKISDPTIKEFIAKGTNPDKSKRYQSLNELEEAVRHCFAVLEF